MSEPGIQDLHAVIADLLAVNGDPARRVRLRITSGSMRPLIQPGDTVVCAPAALEQLRSGDILIVRRAGDFLAHRLIHRRGEAWYTKGDRSRWLDAPVDGTQILARVTAIEPAQARRAIDLNRWDQRIIQRCKGIWGGIAAAFFRAARALRNTRSI